MKIVIAIPTGNRVRNIIKVVEKIRKVCGFLIAIYTWDPETKAAINGKVDYLFEGPLQSFAKNQNMMAAMIPDWDGFICGADDLYPDFGMDLIPEVCRMENGNIIWVKDGLFNKQATHPIITRGWYEKHNKKIFDENYHHNFCDTDLFLSACLAGEMIKCFNIGFDHRHPLKDGRKPDDIYRLGQSTYVQDGEYFESKFTAEERTRELETPEISLVNE